MQAKDVLIAASALAGLYVAYTVYKREPAGAPPAGGRPPIPRATNPVSDFVDGLLSYPNGPEFQSLGSVTFDVVESARAAGREVSDVAGWVFGTAEESTLGTKLFDLVQEWRFGDDDPAPPRPKLHHALAAIDST